MAMPIQSVHVWEDDPGAHPSSRTPITRDGRSLDNGPLAFKIKDSLPGAHSSKEYTLRYWTASDSLGRAREWFTDPELGPDIHSWAIPETLPVKLDSGEGLNAKYERDGHSFGIFFSHRTSRHQTIYSCESPDIVCHEAGHAMLDALQPMLHGLAEPECASFHEVFGDISSMLSALRLDSFCSHVIHDTHGELTSSSRLSRMAEQLASEVRRATPGKADSSCLRDIANEFFYVKPSDLPKRAPAWLLCNEPHSFSRIFSAAFLDILSGTFESQGNPVIDLQDAARVAGRLLCKAISATPISIRYWGDLAAHMIAMDRRLYEGEHEKVLRHSFGVSRGILSFEDLEHLNDEVLSEEITDGEPTGDCQPPDSALRICVPGSRYGISRDIQVRFPGEAPRFVKPSNDDAFDPVYAVRLATGFVDSLFIHGRVSVVKEVAAKNCLACDASPKSCTHEIRPTEIAAAELRQVAFL
ncbi:hypothetical protein ACTPOK_20215 [Streptomyces inhibens]|uniref:hypothetical protein n=1 Tax=Streptomyces inhibens TaxID=2293571 RepID=UPI00402AA22A